MQRPYEFEKWGEDLFPEMFDKYPALKPAHDNLTAIHRCLGGLICIASNYPLPVPGNPYYISRTDLHQAQDNFAILVKFCMLNELG